MLGANLCQTNVRRHQIKNKKKSLPAGRCAPCLQLHTDCYRARTLVSFLFDDILL